MAIALLIRSQARHTSRFLRPVFQPAIMSRAQSTSLKSYLVSPSELNESLKQNAPNSMSTAPKTIPVSANWFLPNDPQGRDGFEVFKKAHIAKSRFFNLDKISDTSSPYPHMLPSPKVFKEAMSNLGINKEDTVVVYDTAELGIFSAPRVAWTFKVFGHEAVHILNNFRLWVEQGYPTEAGEQRQFERTDYPMPKLDEAHVISYEEVRDIAMDHNKEGREEVQILDARPGARFKGTEPEPRPGLPSGHIPNSISIPFPELLDPKTKTLLPPDALRNVFESKGVDPKHRIISSCGTGVTAAIVETALAEGGYNEGRRQLYDGSWTEWAQRVQPTDNLIVKSE